MKRYESYKDSGVKWLGEIPGHWEVLPLKYIFKLQKKLVGRNSNKYKLLSLTLQGIKVRDLENPTGKFPSSFDSYQIVEPGDFIFCNFDNEETPRAVGQSRFKGMITGAYDVFGVNNNNMDSNYLLYYCLYIDDAKRFKPLYKGLRKTIPFDSFMSYKIAIPPKAEQTAIANYLDSVTSKIDEAISQQQKMIDLLNERKQIIIQNAVTKGLDPNAKMKDSGVEWIGEIPENWEVKRFRFLFKEKNERNTLIKERKQLQFKMGNIVLKDRQDLTNEMINVISNYNIVKPGHIVLNGLNLNYDFVSQRIALVKERGIITSAYICIESINDINTSYYCYFMKAMDSKKLFHGMGSGIRLTLSYDNLKNLFFPYPSINDQIEIVKYLDSVSSKIDSSISQCNKMISLLQERKQIIINDVVTGKVKVI